MSALKAANPTRSKQQCWRVHCCLPLLAIAALSACTHVDKKSHSRVEPLASQQPSTTTALSSLPDYKPLKILLSGSLQPKGAGSETPLLSRWLTAFIQLYPMVKNGISQNTVTLALCRCSLSDSGHAEKRGMLAKAARLEGDTYLWLVVGGHQPSLLAREFIRFVQSQQGQALLPAQGYHALTRGDLSPRPHEPLKQERP